MEWKTSNKVYGERKNAQGIENKNEGVKIYCERESLKQWKRWGGMSIPSRGLELLVNICKQKNEQKL